MKDLAVRRWGLVAAVSLSRVAFGYQFQSLASLGPELLERFGLGYLLNPGRGRPARAEFAG